jgi:hypothetical protein
VLLLWMGVPIYITVELILIPDISFFNHERKKLPEKQKKYPYLSFIVPSAQQTIRAPVE